MKSKNVIMCVDDETQVLESLVRDLESKYKNNDIETCESAEEALELREELISEGNNIIYIVDQRMPGTKGIEFLERLEKDAGKILLTAYADTEVAIRGINNRCIDFYIMKPYGEELFKAIDHLIMSKEHGIFVTVARTPEEREKALKTQNTVFSEEHLGLPYEKGIKIIGESPYTEETTIYVAVSNREMVGTTSLSRRNDEFARRFGTNLGLPIEEFYDISKIAELDNKLAQVRNATVVPEYQNRRIGPMIWGQIYRDLTEDEQKSRYVCILAASEIREGKKAKALFEKIKESDIYCPDISIRLKDKFAQPPAEVNQADIDEAVIPRRIKLFSKMNFRIIGEPVYYENFKMYDFPMLLELNNVAEPYKTWFSERKM